MFQVIFEYYFRTLSSHACFARDFRRLCHHARSHFTCRTLLSPPHCVCLGTLASHVTFRTLLLFIIGTPQHIRTLFHFRKHSTQPHLRTSACPLNASGGTGRRIHGINQASICTCFFLAIEQKRPKTCHDVRILEC